MKTTLTILLTFLTMTIFGQKYTQTVKGKITDTDTKVTLPGANIIIEGSNPIIGT